MFKSQSSFVFQLLSDAYVIYVQILTYRDKLLRTTAFRLSLWKFAVDKRLNKASKLLAAVVWFFWLHLVLSRLIGMSQNSNKEPPWQLLMPDDFLQATAS